MSRSRKFLWDTTLVRPASAQNWTWLSNLASRPASMCAIADRHGSVCVTDGPIGYSNLLVLARDLAHTRAVGGIVETTNRRSRRYNRRENDLALGRVHHRVPCLLCARPTGLRLIVGAHGDVGRKLDFTANRVPAGAALNRNHPWRGQLIDGDLALLRIGAKAKAGVE